MRSFVTTLVGTMSGASGDGVDGGGGGGVGGVDKATAAAFFTHTPQ